MLICAVSLLSVSLFSAGVGALQFKANVTGAPDVAAVIPTYKDDFNKIAPFLKEWSNCAVGQQNIDIYVIFSNQDEPSNFDKFYGGRGPWKALVMSDPTHGHLASWKKLDGLAQLLASSHYKYILMPDCELGVKKCDGFDGFAKSLRQKFLAKTWYGSSFSDKRVFEVNSKAACAVVDCTQAGAVDALKAATKDFQLFTWWMDIPWVETTSAKQMFEKWGELVEARNSAKRVLRKDSTTAGADAKRLAQSDEVLEPVDYVDMLHAAIREGILGQSPSQLAEVDPVAVADELGGSSRIAELNAANTAFEHIIYQYYMVLNNGFSVHDLNQDGLGFPAGAHCRGSDLEQFWHLYGSDEEKQAKYITLVHPLWITSNSDEQNHVINQFEVTEYIPLAFHTDRVRFNRVKAQ